MKIVTGLSAAFAVLLLSISLLVRGVGAGGSMTWHERGASQAGSRDAEINAALPTCP